MDPCRTCRFWKKHDENGGSCLRYPPTPIMFPQPPSVVGGKGTINVRFVLPAVEPNFCCGEWAAKEEPVDS